MEKHCPQTLERTEAFSRLGTKELRPCKTKRQAALQTTGGLKRLSQLGLNTVCLAGEGFHGCQGIDLLSVSSSSLSHGIDAACVCPKVGAGDAIETEQHRLTLAGKGTNGMYLPWMGDDRGIAKRASCNLSFCLTLSSFFPLS